jgi:predicted RNase H-like nuclease (RuvC/YqgF family)
MKTIKNCKCNLQIRDDESSLTLTTHHPTCRYFSPSAELQGLEDQCKHFLKENIKLKRIIRDLKDKIASLEEEVDLSED